MKKIYVNNIMDFENFILEEVDLDFNKSSKRIKMDEDVDEMPEFNLKQIKTKIKSLEGEIRLLMAEIVNLHNEISIFYN